MARCAENGSAPGVRRGWGKDGSLNIGETVTRLMENRGGCVVARASPLAPRVLSRGRLFIRRGRGGGGLGMG